jgi:flagellar biosynthesis protein FlhG
MGIWSVGGGKGGTGKSLVANGLALALAERGARVVLVDAGFGGPNQHTCCGIRKPSRTLAQFFEERLALEDLVLETAVPGLRLVPGHLDSPSADAITWAQKQKLFRHLRALRAGHGIATPREFVQHLCAGNGSRPSRRAASKRWNCRRWWCAAT